MEIGEIRKIVEYEPLELPSHIDEDIEAPIEVENEPIPV
jgi:hypothetical protein